MTDKFEMLNKLLKELPVDTAYEQGLIEAAAFAGEKEICLVAGTQDSALFRLLPVGGELFKAGELPPFYVTAEYGGEFSICAVNKRGENEIYMTAEDFRAYCAARFGEIVSCTVQTPCDLLKKYSLRFFLMDGVDAAHLNKVANGCGGCVIVAEADAGALPDDYMTLCGYLAEERCIGDKVSMVLNQRTMECNDMLSIMAATMLGRESIDTFVWDTQAASAALTRGVLEQAVGGIMGLKAAGADEGVFNKCCDLAIKKLEAKIEETEERRAGYIESEEAYNTALKNFTAMADMGKYGLGDLLENHEKEAVRREIHGMFLSVEEALPELIGEVLEKSARPKEDLRQLTGDYLSSLINDFIEKLLNQVAAEQLIPRAEKQFARLCDRFSTVMSSVKLEPEDDISHALAEFLKMSDINIGQYHTQLAGTLSGIVGALVKWALLNSLYELEILSFGSVNIVNKLMDALEKKVTNWVDALTPKGMYGRSLNKDLIKHLNEQDELLCSQLDENILPRLYDYMKQEYEKLTGIYEKQLKDKKEHYGSLQRDEAQMIASLQQNRQAVEALRSAV